MQFVVVVVVCLLVVGVFLFARSRRSNDGVEGFRRQIDALSSDARRPTIGLGGTPDGEDDAAGPDDAAAAGTTTADDPGAAEHVDQDPPVAGAPDIDPGFRRPSEDAGEGPDDADTAKGGPDGA